MAVRMGVGEGVEGEVGISAGDVSGLAAATTVEVAVGGMEAGVVGSSPWGIGVDANWDRSSGAQLPSTDMAAPPNSSLAKSRRVKFFNSLAPVVRSRPALDLAG